MKWKEITGAFSLNTGSVWGGVKCVSASVASSRVNWGIIAVDDSWNVTVLTGKIWSLKVLCFLYDTIGIYLVHQTARQQIMSSIILEPDTVFNRQKTLSKCRNELSWFNHKGHWSRWCAPVQIP